MVPTVQKPHSHQVGFHSFPASQTGKLILCLLLALATLALYDSVTHAPFLNYDDQVYVTDNPQVRAGLSRDSFVWAFRTPRALDWHPLTWLSFLVDKQLFGLNPTGYHTTNVFLHVASAVLLFLLLESATRQAWRSLAVTVLFALHPINVESVAWVAERKSVLSMFFFLVALAAYGWYTRRPGLGRYLTVTFAYILALMSKAQVITFPCVLLLLDYWPLRRHGHGFTSRQEQESDLPPADAQFPSFWSLIAEKVPWFALSCVSAVITMKTGGAAFSYIVVTDATPQFPLWLRLANAAISYARYLEKAFWPINLALIYPHPGFAISIPAALLSAILILAITFTVVFLRRCRFLFVGWFWFLGTLVPMSGIIPIGGHAMADRYAYIPLLGIFVIICWGAADLIERWEVPAAVYAACACAILLMLAWALHRQVSYWTDNVTLWAHTVEVTKDNSTAEELLATSLIIQGRKQEALPHFERAHRLQPADPQATLNLATYEQMLGHYQSALDGYAAVVHSNLTAPPLLVTARANSGYAHMSLKQYDNAVQDFRAALATQPTNAAAYRGLGLAEQRGGNLAQAIRDYQSAAQLEPSAVNYLLLAQALGASGETNLSRAALNEAASTSSNMNDDLDTIRRLLTQ